MILLFAALLLADTANTAVRTVNKLAEGIWEIRHPDAPDGFPQGNTTVIAGDKAVLVVDSCLLPSAAREDIAQIRQWTKLPVTWLVNTHWHFDHTMGNATYASAFPGLRIAAQTETARQIAGFNQGASDRYPDRRKRFETWLQTGKHADGRTMSDLDREEFKKALGGLDATVREMKSTRQLAPDVIFDRELTIDLGRREVRILFLGRGNTAGDTVVWLPAEKIVAAGDLLDHPVPYFYGGFPVDLIATLRKLAELDPRTIVPGHGDVLSGNSYIGQVIDLVTAVRTEVEKEMNAGLTREEVIETVRKRVDFASLRKKFAGDDRENEAQFDSTFAGLVKTTTWQVFMR